MPIEERYLRYSTPGLLKSEDVSKVIAKIEQNGSISRDRTSTGSEQIVQDVRLPVIYKLPSGVVFAPSNNDLIIDYDPGIWPTPSSASLLQLSAFADVSVGVEFKKYKHTYECRLDVKDGVCGMQLSAGLAAGLEKAEKIECLRKISEYLRLPIDLSQTAQPTSSREGLGVALGSLEPSVQSVNLTCGLSQQSFQDVFERLLIESKRKLSFWRVQDTGVVSFLDLVGKVNAAGFPSRKTQIDHWWRLGSYKDFPAMTEMAARNDYGDVGQSLFDFEFSNGKPGRLNARANKKGGFKLLFNFLTKEDQAEFTGITGINLSGPQ